MTTRGGGGVVVESWSTTARRAELSCGWPFRATTTHSPSFPQVADRELWLNAGPADRDTIAGIVAEVQQ